jgi:exopolyphosphatase/guanosine-5'-triphosphate,3'-diphosphate pyrophosphatase
VEQLRKTSVAERNKMPGMDPKRSDLLPLGGLILQETMNFFSIEEVIASHHGLRYGLLWEELIQVV